MRNGMDRESGVVDAAVIGGSFAGVSAALQLARGRRQVVVIDEGQTRNRLASAGHGFLGMDGRPPAEMRAAGLRDLLAYPEARLIEARVTDVVAEGPEFALTLATGAALRARRLVLAYGMRDLLPNLPGLADIWGETAFSCPYCHGYELAGRPTGLLAGPGIAEFAIFLREWTDDLTLFPMAPLPKAEQVQLRAAGVQLADGLPLRLSHEGRRVTGAVMPGGQVVPLAALYVKAGAEPACDLAQRLGCGMEAGMQGPIIATSMMKATTVHGAFAAGDVARPVPSAVMAAADGAMAGAACHRDLAQAFPRAG